MGEASVLRVGLITVDARLESQLTAAIGGEGLDIARDAHSAARVLAAPLAAVVVDLAARAILAPPFAFPTERDDLVLIDRAAGAEDRPFLSFRRDEAARLAMHLRAPRASSRRAAASAARVPQKVASLREMEREVVLATFEANAGNVSKTARALGVARSTLREMLRRHHARRRRILLVEDDDTLRAALCERLESAGYEVVEAAGGREALAAFEAAARRVDAVVCDVVMPRMNGGELARALRERSTHVPVIFISGYPAGHLLDDGAIDAASAFLRKPFPASALLSKLRGVMPDRA